MKSYCKLTLVSILAILSAACSDSTEEEDRNSQATGALSAFSQEILPAKVQVLREDEFYSVSVIITENASINVQIENLSATAVEMYAMTEANFNLYNANQSFEYISDLSLTPLSASFSSEWTVLSPGRYYFVVDNTNRGAINPPFNGIDDQVTVMMTILGRLASDEAGETLASDVDEFGQGETGILSTSVGQVPNPEGF